MAEAASNRRRNKPKEWQSAAQKRAFAERVLRYTVDQFILGDMRSRAAYLARALTWSVRRLARAIRSSLRPRYAKSSNPFQGRVSIAVVTGGGLGDVLSTSKYIEQLYIAARHPLIDVFYAHESYLRFLLARAPYVSRLFPTSALDDLRWKYDAIIEVHRLVRYDLVNFDRISRLCPELFWLRNVSARRNGEYSPHWREMPQLDGDLAKRAVLRGMNRKSLLGYSGAVDIESDDWIFVSPSYDALRIFNRADLKPGHYVTLHDGFDTAHRFPSRSTKQWSSDHWQRFIAKLRSTHPELKIVQIGGRNSIPYEGIHVDLVGKATFHEVAWLLKYAVCHVDTESGLVRLAREVGGKSIVIFGPTDPNFFSFTENVNLKPSKCGNCFWSTQDWLMTCPKGLDEPECTASITPERVLAELEMVIDEHKQLRRRVAVAKYLQHSDDRSSAERRSGSPNLLHHNLATEICRNCAPLSAEDKIQESLQSMMALMRDQIRGRTVKVALVASQEYGSEIERHLTTMNGVCTTWFCLAHRNENQDGALVKSPYEFFESKAENSEDDRECYSRRMTRKGRVGDEPELHYGSALNIPASRSTFDFVIFASDLNDKLQSGFALREMVRVLKLDGTLICLPHCNSEASDEIRAVDLLNPEQLKNMLDEHDIVLQENIAGPAIIGSQPAFVIKLLPSARYQAAEMSGR
jgi:ADP-heptose:LPS heptosyltransferase